MAWRQADAGMDCWAHEPQHRRDDSDVGVLSGASALLNNFNEIVLGDAADALSTRYVSRRDDQDLVAGLDCAIEIA